MLFRTSLLRGYHNLVLGLSLFLNNMRSLIAPASPNDSDTEQYHEHNNLSPPYRHRFRWLSLCASVNPLDDSNGEVDDDGMLYNLPRERVANSGRA